MLTLDHLAVLGETLEEAAAHCEAALGVPMLPGGRHKAFGTHNMLQGLGEGLYLEAIATDPGGAPPAGPRWFGLDDFHGAPRLGAWICRVDDLDTTLAALPEAGRAVAVSRGNLRWRISLPEGGLTPYDGLFPVLIEWDVPVPPGKALPTSGCRLGQLEVAHPQAEALRARLADVLDDDRVRFLTDDTPALRARFECARGTRVLS